MQFNFSKVWCLEAATNESGINVAAGGKLSCPVCHSIKIEILDENHAGCRNCTFIGEIIGNPFSTTDEQVENIPYGIYTVDDIGNPIDEKYLD